MLEQPPLWFILIAFIAALGPLVFIHEMGHYLVGRWFGVGAETFSIGFGPELGGWTDKRGTRWKVAAVPLGGYVRFVGDEDAASAPANPESVAPQDRDRSFHLKPVWQRFLIVLAGPMANFLLAILIFAAFFQIYGYPQTPNVVAGVAPGSAAAAAEIRPGDRIVSIAGREIETFEELSSVVMLRPAESVPIALVRDGQLLQLTATLGTDEEVDRFGQRFKKGLLGIYATERVFERLSPADLLPASASYTVRLTRTMIDGLWQIISGRRSIKDLGGPLKMAQIAGQQASLGFFEFVQLVALFSINLGFINLLPIPMLDGGHLLFYTVEAVRRRPVSVQAQDWAFRGGLALLLALIVFTTINDLDSFGLWDRLGRLIG